VSDGTTTPANFHEAAGYLLVEGRNPLAMTSAAGALCAGCNMATGFS